jgi:hypothetical protein
MYNQNLTYVSESQLQIAGTDSLNISKPFTIDFWH